MLHLKKIKSIYLLILLLLTSISLSAQSYQKINLVDKFNVDIEISAEETLAKITTKTNSIFSHAIDRVPFFVDTIYKEREDDQLWTEEFNRLVLKQEDLNMLKKNLLPLYQKDLSKLISFMVKQAVKTMKEKIETININYSGSNKNINRLFRSLPSAKQIAAKIYNQLDKDAKNKSSNGIGKMFTNTKTGTKVEAAVGIVLVSYIFSTALPIISAAALYTAMKVKYDLDIADYKIQVTRLVRKQRNKFILSLRDHYILTLKDARKRIETLINDLLAKYEKKAFKG